jgi:Ca2+:H+ antiporter
VKKGSFLPVWTVIAPLAGWIVLALPLHPLLLAGALLASVLAAVHHAELVAHRVGEPAGTLVLAGAITVIELAMILTMMAAMGAEGSALPRDTVVAAVMIILNGIVGLCLIVGGARFGEQSFRQFAVNASLATLAAIVGLTLVLPNFTKTTPGPVYSGSQLGFVAVVSLLLYGTFIFVQTVRHREYFQPVEPDEEHAPRPSAAMTWAGAGLLFSCLGAVVLLAEHLSPLVEAGVVAIGAPRAAVGIVISAVVLLPEGTAALRAASRNRLQTSLNQALGSALASIGFTIPAVALVSLAKGWTLTLGVEPKEGVLLLLSLFVATQSLAVGRTTVLQGAVHLCIFAVYIFTAIIP